MLTPSRLLSRLKELTAVSQYVVAFSGGMDSHVLLHALVQCVGAKKVRVLHVNHGWHDDASEWAQHCQAVCEALSVPLTINTCSHPTQHGKSPEEIARQVRYAWMTTQLTSNEALLTAHHQDDQAETLLLQLLRGAGPKGLAAMPESMPLGDSVLLRPLLPVSRAQLLGYASENSLHFLEDPSNEALRYDRNFLRQRILPLLTSRWPAVAQTLSRSAAHCAEADQLMGALAAQDIAEHQLVDEDNTLCLIGLTSLSAARQRNVLRYWIEGQGFRLPSESKLTMLQAQMLHSAPDRLPKVEWEGVMVRRYRQRLHVMAPHALVLEPLAWHWQSNQIIALPGRLGQLCCVPEPHPSAQTVFIDPHHPLAVRFRKGGERIRLPGRAGSRALKKLFQEWGVLPWQREAVPLLYQGGRIVAVVGYCVCADFEKAQSGQVEFNVTH